MVMTETLYPHQSPTFWGIVGIIIVIAGTLIELGAVNGWFTPPLPDIGGRWCSTYNVITHPSLLGIDPFFLGSVLIAIGLIIFIGSAMFIAIQDDQENSRKYLKYCPHCKREMP
jgi:hypothetical protein